MPGTSEHPRHVSPSPARVLLPSHRQYGAQEGVAEVETAPDEGGDDEGEGQVEGRGASPQLEGDGAAEIAGQEDCP